MTEAAAGEGVVTASPAEGVRGGGGRGGVGWTGAGSGGSRWGVVVSCCGCRSVMDGGSGGSRAYPVCGVGAVGVVLAALVGAGITGPNMQLWAKVGC